LAELAEQYDVHPNQIQDWKEKLLTGAEKLFGTAVANATDHAQLQQKLHAKIGQLTMEKVF
jgi:transposase